MRCTFELEVGIILGCYEDAPPRAGSDWSFPTSKPDGRKWRKEANEAVSVRSRCGREVAE